MTRILVCGGRHYDNSARVNAILDGYRRETPHDALRIIQGGATGADRLARLWCMQRRIPYDNFSANWKEFGSAAGPIRNARMLEVGKPDLVVAFPGGKGTADMIAKARAAGVEVVEISDPHATDLALAVAEEMQRGRG